MKKIICIGLSIFAYANITLAQQSQPAPAPQPSAMPAPVAQAAAKSEFTIDKSVVAGNVESREPVGESKEFDSTATKKAYYWTKVSGKNIPANIKHVWSADGKKIVEVPLAVKYPTTRTWSYQTIWPGKWKVEATDESGNVLSTTDFTVK